MNLSTSLFFAIIFNLLFINCFAQNQIIDSLTIELDKSKQDTTSIRILIKISEEYRFSDPEKSEEYCLKALKIQKDTNSVENKKIWARINDNIGISKAIRGNYEESINYFFNSLNVRVRIKDMEGVATSYNNIGNIYKATERKDDALKYYLKSYEIFKGLNDEKLLSMALNNIATIYAAQEKYDKALNYYRQAEAIKIKLNDTKGLIYSYNNYAVIYDLMNELDSALFYNEKAEKLLIKDENYDNLLSVMAVRAKIYTKQKKYDVAEELLLRCIDLAIEKNYPNRLMMAYGYFIDLCIEKENYKDAYKYSKLHTEVKDSLYNIQYEKEIANLNVKYESEQQKQQILLQQEQLRKEKIIRYAVAIGALIIFLLASLIYARYRVKSKLNKKLNEKNEIIEKKNKEITDSIQYAKRIQSAILPPNKLVKEYLPESFILYKPKDIVAGDFYWMEHKNGKVLFAACDCTGHGVPGAMVSVICNNALNRSVREHGLTNPEEILNKTREIVVQEFEKSDEEVKDGMDIALCSLEFTRQNGFVGLGNGLEVASCELKYAGANNPLWIIRNCHSEPVEGRTTENIFRLAQHDNKYELVEITANKQPIGKFDNPEPYTTHTFELQKGDSIYIFSDGYADQFGGEKGKKFKAKAFKNLLLNIQEKSMEEQRILIDETFENWKGNIDQVDDVCIIGVRV